MQAICHAFPPVNRRSPLEAPTVAAPSPPLPSACTYQRTHMSAQTVTCTHTGACTHTLSPRLPLFTPSYRRVDLVHEARAGDVLHHLQVCRTGTRRGGPRAAQGCEQTQGNTGVACEHPPTTHTQGLPVNNPPPHTRAHTSAFALLLRARRLAPWRPATHGAAPQARPVCRTHLMAVHHACLRLVPVPVPMAVHMPLRLAVPVPLAVLCLCLGPPCGTPRARAAGALAAPGCCPPAARPGPAPTGRSGRRRLQAARQGEAGSFSAHAAPRLTAAQLSSRSDPSLPLRRRLC